VLSSVIPQLTKWQAEGKVDAILTVDGEEGKPLNLGGYRITLLKQRKVMRAAGSGAPADQNPPQAMHSRRESIIGRLRLSSTPARMSSCS
jgi:hypothetical protein